MYFEFHFYTRLFKQLIKVNRINCRFCLHPNPQELTIVNAIIQLDNLIFCIIRYIPSYKGLMFHTRHKNILV